MMYDKIHNGEAEGNGQNLGFPNAQNNVKVSNLIVCRTRKGRLKGVQIKKRVAGMAFQANLTGKGR
jgi:hypothetical protein